MVDVIAQGLPEGKLTIADVKHPEYTIWSIDWEKWRLTYGGGRAFITKYLHHYSPREDTNDFQARLRLTYNPAFAKGAINDIKDSIYSRMKDIVRINGPSSYKNSILGLNGGVDLLGSSMNSFIGQKLLPELLVMARVGVYVDKDQLNGPTIAQNLTNRPYIYLYRAEDIRSWSYDSKNQLVGLLLNDTIEQIDETTRLPKGTYNRFRLLNIEEDGLVHVKFYSASGAQVNAFNEPSTDETILNLKEIPFAFAGLSASLMMDIADYQIGLLNLASANLSYALSSNFPFYTEQYDVRSETPYAKPNFQDEEGNQVSNKPPEKEIQVGSTAGRRYPKGIDRPGFIHPSPEPLKASMELGVEMRHDIRQLLNLTLSALEPKFASAESKDMDQRGLESGLSYIGLECQNIERKIAYFWSLYENIPAATVNYPEQYALKNEADIAKESENNIKLQDRIPSRAAKKELCKILAKTNLGCKITYDQLQTIYREIDAAEFIDSTAVNVQQDVLAGLVDKETASTARGYDGPSVVPKAEAEFVKRQAEIAKSQSKPRGTEGSNKDVPANDKTKQRGPQASETA